MDLAAFKYFLSLLRLLSFSVYLAHFLFTPLDGQLGIAGYLATKGRFLTFFRYI